MSISTDQYQRILGRLAKLETTMNDVLTAIDRYVSVGQVNELLALTQTDISTLRTDLDSLMDRVETIEEEPLL